MSREDPHNNLQGHLGLPSHTWKRLPLKCPMTQPGFRDNRLQIPAEPKFFAVSAPLQESCSHSQDSVFCHQETAKGGDSD